MPGVSIILGAEGTPDTVDITGTRASNQLTD